MDNKKYKVPAIIKAINILEYLSEVKEATFPEICTKMGTPKSSTYQIINTLAALGYIRKIDDSSKYSLGMKLIELGNKAVSNLNIRNAAKPVLRALVAKLNETCHLGIMDGYEGVYLDKCEGTQPVRLYSWIGKRLPLHCTAIGKALLAWQDEQKIEEILNQIELTRVTENTIINPKKLKEHLRMVRDRGWALDDQENEPHIRCIGAPIRNTDGKILGAISISGLSVRFDGEYLKRLSREAMEAAEELSAKISMYPGDSR